MADLISRVSKINTATKLWVVGLGLVLALGWSVDSGSPSRTATSPPPSAAPSSVSPTTVSTPAPTNPSSSTASSSKRPTLTASSTLPAETPATESSIKDLPPLTGTYSGTVNNLTAAISADFKIAVMENNGEIHGCMDVKPPLYGSGPLQGTMNGSKVSFVVTSDSMQIAFDGRRDAGRLNGTYLVSARDRGSKQTGTFVLQKMFSQTPPDAACAPAERAGTPVIEPAPPIPAPKVASEAPAVSNVAPVPVERRRTAPAGYFTVGSTKDEVLAVQGTPTRLSDTQWAYGLSHVTFQNGRVTSWYVSPVNSLHATMMPDNEADAATARGRGYFTVGSTKDEVLGVQGTPTSFSGAQWTYGLSHVSFQNGRVVSWYISPVNSLRVKMLASDGSAAVRSASYFSVGSTKDEVLAAQGTPTSFSDTQWTYGLSHVTFQNGKVSSWYVSPVNSLRAKMVPENPMDAEAARARGYFTVGSTKDEVLAVQGTPTSFSETQWSYGLSHVTFQNGRVTTWYISPVNSLRVAAPK